jgi:signal recognition particle subunit SRP54
MGSMGGLVKLIPGMNKVTPQQIHDAESHNHRLHDQLNDSQGMCRFGAPCQVSFKKEKCCTWFWKNQEQVNVLNCSVTDFSDAYADEESGKCDARGSSIPGLELGLEDPHSGQSKAKPGAVKRRKNSWGFQSWFISSGAEEVLFQKDLVPKNEQREVMSF